MISVMSNGNSKLRRQNEMCKVSRREQILLSKEIAHVCTNKANAFKELPQQTTQQC